VNRGIRVFFVVALYALLGVGASWAQDDPGAAPAQQAPGGGGGQWQNGQRPVVFGKITAMHDGALEITGPDGQAVTVKLTPQTQFRKDREPAKISDFKVGDMVAVRGDKNADNSVTAKMVNARTQGMGGPGGRSGGGMMATPGTLGKDYVAGEVKSIDAPKMTVLRTDGVTQTLELTEETSLRRGRDSITMADIKVGDHIMARGAAQNDTFVPRGVMVMNEEQWQRMQQWLSQAPAGQQPQSGSGANAAKPNTPEATAPKPQE
jgi:Cu/Ag efflux protein CusF